ncbi:MAG TPA: hypothetical protein VKA85_01500 [Candidatus Limnocylindrales bacterium]|nr:hypothetical protein [Candidatus Limnocylindrales bacterium]
MTALITSPVPGVGVGLDCGVADGAGVGDGDAVGSGAAVGDGTGVGVGVTGGCVEVTVTTDTVTTAIGPCFAVGAFVDVFLMFAFARAKAVTWCDPVVELRGTVIDAANPPCASLRADVRGAPSQRRSNHWRAGKLAPLSAIVAPGVAVPDTDSDGIVAANASSGIRSRGIRTKIGRAAARARM